MVHALEKIYQLIRPNGQLIDIHPSSEPASIEVRLRDRIFPAGWLRETDDYIEYEVADQALASVVDSGLFTLERHGLFSFVWYADTLEELRTYLAEEWKDAIIDDVTFVRAEELMSGIERDKGMILRETVNIARFRRQSPDRKGMVIHE